MCELMELARTAECLDVKKVKEVAVREALRRVEVETCCDMFHTARKGGLVMLEDACKSMVLRRFNEVRAMRTRFELCIGLYIA